MYEILNTINSPADVKKLNAEQLETLAADGNLWNDPERAQKILSERTALNNAIERVKQAETQVQNTYEMIEIMFSYESK